MLICGLIVAVTLVGKQVVVIGKYAATASLATSLSAADSAVLVINQAICSWLRKNGASLDYIASNR